MPKEQVQHNNAPAWAWFIIGALLLIGWVVFSQTKDRSDYNDTLRVTGAKVECRAEAKREGWSEAEAGCDRLGTPGYDISTDNYFNSYKLRTGIRGL